MDPSDNFPTNRSPRSREILGPRPTPLKVRKDPHKTRRPPLAPPPPSPPQQQQQDHQEAPPRGGPVIIYTVSPKIIHANPGDFMTIVQRLTGKTSSSSSSSSSSATSEFAPRETTPFRALNNDNNITPGSISPAARYAAMEKANASLGFVEGMEMGHEHYHHHHHHHHHQHQNLTIERPSFSPGILSPGPTSLPPISPSFFSPPPPDPLGLPLYGDLSSILQTSPSMASPYSSPDLFNNFSDF